IQVSDDFAQPAFLADFLTLGRVPHIEGTEVGAVGGGLADPIDDRPFALVPELLDGPHAGMETKGIADGKDGLRGNVDLWAVFIIESVGVGNDGVQGIVSARELDHHQGALRCARSHNSSPYAVRPYICMR